MDPRAQCCGTSSRMFKVTPMFMSRPMGAACWWRNLERNPLFLTFPPRNLFLWRIAPRPEPWLMGGRSNHFSGRVFSSVRVQDVVRVMSLQNSSMQQERRCHFTPAQNLKQLNVNKYHPAKLAPFAPDLLSACGPTENCRSAEKRRGERVQE